MFFVDGKLRNLRKANLGETKMSALDYIKGPACYISQKVYWERGVNWACEAVENPKKGNYIIPSEYDFVLLYSLHEVPGWICSGPRYFYPAKNIGLKNSFYNISSRPANWNKLKSVPNMNSVGFTKDDSEILNAHSTLTAIHEMYHYWGVNITRNNNVGPREWKNGDPIAWLASATFHWTWVWSGEGMPGIMYSGPTSNKFNAFDLFLMGLMSYEEASKITYQIHENKHPENTHDLVLDDLIYSLSLGGPDYYEGNGRRIPDTDDSTKNLKTLIAIVKGRDETLTKDNEDLIKKLASDLPKDWNVATWERSTMDTNVKKKK
ncbi:MAG: hypothetical protein NT030_03240 [Candidatus Saganbacteria bacterium]|nr:hypothetical protein [Candidatus Saganbacteria bacterium]